MFEFIVLLLATVFGITNSPMWIVLPIAALLTAPAAAKHSELAQRFADGATRVYLVAAALTFANNVIFAAMSYGTGRAVSWLLAA